MISRGLDTRVADTRLQGEGGEAGGRNLYLADRNSESEQPTVQFCWIVDGVCARPPKFGPGCGGGSAIQRQIS